ncbi:MAG: T9SS type A sorting domain-containing protein [Bacteroidetes bacterium]|nr:T9SS type A sorting domain-containing protein [Bacteroidota bacterium]
MIKKTVLLLLVLCDVITAFAQLNVGGQPIAFTNELPNAATIEMHGFDVETMLREDSQLNQKIGPYRFGENFETGISLSNSGNWHNFDDGRIWQLAIQSKGAYSINLTFADFFIPEGASLYIYSEDREMAIGAFTNLNNNPERIFATDLVKGDKIILEYFEPHHAKGKSSLLISVVTHAYRNLFNWNSRDFGSSGACNININCPEGANWQDQARSVVMLLSGGNGFCTGTFVNNTSEDGTPYLLTASHCGSSGFGAWVFRFNWEASGCSNPATSPSSQSLTGATLRANNSGSDFLLLELNDQIPSTYNPYFSGWSNLNTAATSTTGIHHPNGDIKKISISNQQTSSQVWLSTDTWRVPSWTLGTTEPGSSGSPLFNPNKLLIGQLFGGSAACDNNLEDNYGKFSTSWNGSMASNRLKDWLDPLNIGATTLEGFDPNFSNFNNDAGISIISNPKNGTTFCKDTVIPVALLRNYGLNNLTSVNISFQINALPAQTIAWSGNLATGGIEAITLPAANLPKGTITFTVTSSNPNGATDPNPANDSKTINFTNEEPNNIKLVSPAFIEDFQKQTFPPQGWLRQNPDNNITWHRTINAGGFGESNASVFINNFNYANTGQRDHLITPYLDFQGIIAPVKLEFDVAYARYNSQLFDSLIVSVSTDCGGNWERIYAKGNWELSTVGQVNFQSSAFVPTAGQWRREIINLDNYIGQPHIRVRFENVTGNGNQLYLDNIWVSDGTVGIKGYTQNENFKIYPNPASGILNIETPIGASEILIYNLSGITVLSKPIQNQEINQLKTNSLAPGIYIIEVKTTSGTYWQKFVKMD